MSTYYVPNTVLGNRDTVIRQDKFPDAFIFSEQEKGRKESNKDSQET